MIGKSLGIFTDSYIKKSFELYSVNLIQLRSFLEKEYKDKFKITNFKEFVNDVSGRYGRFEKEDWKKSKNTSHIYENGFFALHIENSAHYLLDGFRRLFWFDELPNIEVFVKVYGKECNESDLLKLLYSFNFWKVLDSHIEDLFYDKGVSLFFYLKSGVNIGKNIPYYKNYLCVEDFQPKDTDKPYGIKADIADKLFFENANLMRDLQIMEKFITTKIDVTHKKEKINCRLPVFSKSSFQVINQYYLGRYLRDLKMAGTLDSFNFEKFIEDSKENIDFLEICYKHATSNQGHSSERWMDAFLNYLGNYIKGNVSNSKIALKRKQLDFKKRLDKKYDGITNGQFEVGKEYIYLYLNGDFSTDKQYKKLGAFGWDIKHLTFEGTEQVSKTFGLTKKYLVENFNFRNTKTKKKEIHNTHSFFKNSHEFWYKEREKK